MKLDMRWLPMVFEKGERQEILEYGPAVKTEKDAKDWCTWHNEASLEWVTDEDLGGGLPPVWSAEGESHIFYELNPIMVQVD